LVQVKECVCAGHVQEGLAADPGLSLPVATWREAPRVNTVACRTIGPVQDLHPPPRFGLLDQCTVEAFVRLNTVLFGDNPAFTSWPCWSRRCADWLTQGTLRKNQRAGHDSPLEVSDVCTIDLTSPGGIDKQTRANDGAAYLQSVFLPSSATPDCSQLDSLYHLHACVLRTFYVIRHTVRRRHIGESTTSRR